MCMCVYVYIYIYISLFVYVSCLSQVWEDSGNPLVERYVVRWPIIPIVHCIYWPIIPIVHCIYWPIYTYSSLYTPIVHCIYLYSMLADFIALGAGRGASR